MAAAADYSDGQRWRFAVACDVLSHRVQVDAEAAAWKTTAPAHPHFPAAVPVATMLLMPGADITPDVGTETEAAPAPATMSIRYAGRVLVLGDILEDRAAYAPPCERTSNRQLDSWTSCRWQGRSPCGCSWRSGGKDSPVGRRTPRPGRRRHRRNPGRRTRKRVAGSGLASQEDHHHCRHRGQTDETLFPRRPCVVGLASSLTTRNKLINTYIY